MIAYPSVSRIYQADLLDLSVPVFSNESPKRISETFEISPNHSFENRLDFLDCFEVSWVSRDKNTWLWEEMTRSKVPELGKLGLWGFSHKQIEKL